MSTVIQTEGFGVRVARGDIPSALVQRLQSSSASRIAIDIETSGLNFRDDKIGAIQVFDGQTVYVVRPPFSLKLLAETVSNENVVKIFHHAMFDLRFLAYKFGFVPKNIRCTKIAAKIVLDDLDRVSLTDIVHYYLGRELSKGQQTSNWMEAALTPDQLLYAARDVIYLPRILNLLMRDAARKRRQALVISSFKYIPTRVQLDISGQGDVFTY